MQIFADNVWWRYNRPNIKKFPEQFATKEEYEIQQYKATVRGAKRNEGTGLVQYNEVLVEPGDGYAVKDMPKAIFVNLSVSRSISQDPFPGGKGNQLAKLIRLLEKNPHLKFCIYNNKKTSDIMEEFDNDVALSSLRAIYQFNERERIKEFNFDEGLINNLKDRQFHKALEKIKISKMVVANPKTAERYDKYTIERVSEEDIIIYRSHKDGSLRWQSINGGEKLPLEEDSPVRRLVLSAAEVLQARDAPLPPLPSRPAHPTAAAASAAPPPRPPRDHAAAANPFAAAAAAPPDPFAAAPPDPRLSPRMLASRAPSDPAPRRSPPPSEAPPRRRRTLPPTPATRPRDGTAASLSALARGSSGAGASPSGP